MAAAWRARPRRHSSSREASIHLSLRLLVASLVQSATSYTVSFHPIGAAIVIGLSAIPHRWVRIVLAVYFSENLRTPLTPTLLQQSLPPLFRIFPDPSR